MTDMFKNNKLLAFLIIGIICINLVACKADPALVIKETKGGYDLSVCLEENEKPVLDALNKLDIHPEIVEDSTRGDATTYRYTETIQGIAFTCDLMFFKEGGNSKLKYYRKEVFFDQWPGSKETKAIQTVFDSIQTLYGTPDGGTDSLQLPSEEKVFATMQDMSKWKKGDLKLSTAYNYSLEKRLTISIMGYSLDEVP